MAESRSQSPIHSDREGDPELEARLEAFVLALGETIDAMQDAEAAGNATELSLLALRFAAESRELGYPQLDAGARRVGDAVRETSPDAVHKAVADLTELAQRVRRGHRSAAS